METSELVDAWLATWLRVRDISATHLDGWPLVHVAGPTRETELVCLDPGPAQLPALLRHVAKDPGAMLTVVATDVTAYRAVPLPAGVRLDRDDETLMDATFSPVEPTTLDDGLTFRWEVLPHRQTYVVESGDAVAALGTVGVADATATFDAVETMPAFQRRGLGRHVMLTLTAQAMARGAARGVLAASAEGRQLYESLGWTPRLEMLSWMGD